MVRVSLLVAIEYRHVVINHSLKADSKGPPHNLQNVRWMLCRAERSFCVFVLYAVHLVHMLNAVSRHLDSVILFEQRSSLWQRQMGMFCQALLAHQLPLELGAANELSSLVWAAALAYKALHVVPILFEPEE